jgi:hypothetical protein
VIQGLYNVRITIYIGALLTVVLIGSSLKYNTVHDRSKTGYNCPSMNFPFLALYRSKGWTQTSQNFKNSTGASTWG